MIYVEFHMMPYLHGSVLIADDDTVSTIYQKHYSGVIAGPMDNLHAYDMERPRVLLQPQTVVECREGAYLILFRLRPRLHCNVADTQEPLAKATVLLQIQMVALPRGRCMPTEKMAMQSEVGGNTATPPCTLFSATRSRVDVYAADEFYRHPTSGLQPPGKPTLCLSKNMQKLDDWIEVASSILVVDAAVDTTPRVLSLAQDLCGDDALPVWDSDCNLQTIQLIPCEHWRRLTSMNWSEEQPQTNLTALTALPPEARVWLEQAEWRDFLYWEPSQASAIEIYTDGSCSQFGTGWAFVLAAVEHGNEVILGYCHGHISAADLSQRGPCHYKTAHLAEMHAIIWATWWMYRFALAVRWQGKINFFWDSCTAGGKADGNFYSADRLGFTLRCLQQALQSVTSESVSHQHVKAHKGDPYNELADAAAKYAAAKPGLDFMPDAGRLMELQTSFASALPWLWLMEGRQIDTAPPMPDQGVLHFHAVNNLAQIDVSLAADTFQRGLDSEEKLTSFSLHFATYNALSLLDFALTRDVGRIGLLREVVHSEAIHFLGLQETRTAEGMTVSSTHIRIASGATEAGHLGVELWISRLCPYAHDPETNIRHCFRMF